MYKPVKQVVPSAVYTTVSVPLASFDRWNGGFVDSVEKRRRRGSKREELKKDGQRIVLNDVISVCLFSSALSLVISLFGVVDSGLCSYLAIHQPPLM